VLQQGITANTPGAIAASFAHTYWWVVGISVVALAPTVLLALIERNRSEALPATAEYATA
jgi:hypothetical protein